jgi:hypothetical protein
MRIKLPVASGILTFVFAFYFSTAPTGIVHGQASTAPATDPPASTFQPAMSIGLSSGTHAFFGVDATLRVLKPVNFRISYNRMRMDVEGISFNASSLGFSGQSLILSSDLDLSTLGLIAELPIGAKRSFRLMGGLMINLNNYINVNGEFAEGVAVNDYELTPERIGTINVNYTTGSAVYPYFGLGFGRSLGVRHLSFALEAGAMVRGRPDIQFNSTGLLSDNAQNGPVLSENFKNVRVHPSVGFWPISLICQKTCLACARAQRVLPKWWMHRSPRQKIAWKTHPKSSLRMAILCCLSLQHLPHPLILL